MMESSIVIIAPAHIGKPNRMLKAIDEPMTSYKKTKIRELWNLLKYLNQ